MKAVIGQFYKTSAKAEKRIEELSGATDIRILDINHIDRKLKKRPKKLQYTWQRRLKEWKQNKKNLEILCANCHRIHTWLQMGWGKN